MSGYLGKNNIQITEQSANAMPSFSVTTAQLTGTLSQAFSYTPTVTDPDKITHSFFLAGSPPPEYSVNSTTGEITATAVQQSGSPITFELKVTDGPNTATQNIQITVSDIAVEYTGSNLPSGTLYIDTAYTFTPTITNPNNVTLTFSATGLPTGWSIDASTGVISGTGTESGSFSIVVTVVDQYNNSQNLTAIPVSLNIGPLTSTPSGASQLINSGYGAVFTSTTNFTIPSGINYVRIVAVGGGANGTYTYSGSAAGGGGGGLGYKSNLSVTPGSTLSITTGGQNTTSSAGGAVGNAGSNGGSSGYGGSFSGDGGGSGGETENPGGYNQSGGGGAGGYSGNGGNGASSTGYSGQGGGGGGGAGGHWSRGGGGGGTGISLTVQAGANGSGGQQSSVHSNFYNNNRGTAGTPGLWAMDGSHDAQGGHGGRGGGGGGGGQSNYGYSAGNGGAGYVAVWWNPTGGSF